MYGRRRTETSNSSLANDVVKEATLEQNVARRWSHQQGDRNGNAVPVDGQARDGKGRYGSMTVKGVLQRLKREREHSLGRKVEVRTWTARWWWRAATSKARSRCPVQQDWNAMQRVDS